MDVGMERQRTMQSAFSFAPEISKWFRPHADFGTQYTLYRDPNSPSLVQTDSTGAFMLPARVNATQTAGAGFGLDVGKAFGAYSDDSSLTKALTHFFAPVTFNYSRSLLSALDGVPFNPPLAFQLGIGNVDGYRFVNGTPASTAGFTGTFDEGNVFNFPLGISFVNRYRRTTNQDWVLSLDNVQCAGAGADYDLSRSRRAVELARDGHRGGSLRWRHVWGTSTRWRRRRCLAAL